MMLNWIDQQLGKHLGKKLRRLILCSLLGLLLAWGLPVVRTIAQQPPVSLEQAQSLNLQGQQQLERGNPQAALESWLQAETLYRQLGNQDGAIGTQLNQAKALRALGLYHRAKELLKKIAALQQQQPSSSLKANSLLSLGNMLRLTGEYEAAQKRLKESLSIAQQINSPPDIQAAHLHLGNTFLAQEQFLSALDNFKQASKMAGSLQLSAQLHQLRLLQKLERPQAAAELLPQIESQLSTLPPGQLSLYGRIEFAALLSTSDSHKAAKLLAIAAQQAKALGDRRATSYAIGRLGSLYEQTGQWEEAKKLTQQALELASITNEPEILYEWQWQMGRILRSQNKLPEATAAYAATVKTLQSLRDDLVVIGPEEQFSFRDKVEPVYRDLVDLLLRPSASGMGKKGKVSPENLKQARQVIEFLQLAELNNFFREACLDTEIRQIDETDPTAAVIYPVILGDRLEVILSLPGQSLQHYVTQLSQKEIETGIEQMQAALRPTSFAKERLETAQRIYNWLIQPAAPELTKHGIKTLVFVLDGSLRNLPMAALHDGKHYLIEQYQIALAPGLRLLRSKNLQRGQIRALVGGLSEGNAEATPLPGVQQEVDQISQQIPTQVLLNKSFTATTLKTEMQTVPFTVVHLATHGQFSSKAQDTYIQTWDERLTANNMQDVLNQRSIANPTPIELLVLSACETAAGDNRATLGMAGMAVRSGARSTLATLWRVNDASAATFISIFYKTLTQPGISKAQAVRAAQMSLIHSQEFQHPFYWAPFILVGNWL